MLKHFKWAAVLRPGATQQSMQAVTAALQQHLAAATTAAAPGPAGAPPSSPQELLPLLQAFPEVLGWDVQADLMPKLQFFEGLGPEGRRLLRGVMWEPDSSWLPGLRSWGYSVGPKLALLKDVLGSEEEVRWPRPCAGGRLGGAGEGGGEQRDEQEAAQQARACVEGTGECMLRAVAAGCRLLAGSQLQPAGGGCCTTAKPRHAPPPPHGCCGSIQRSLPCGLFVPLPHPTGPAAGAAVSCCAEAAGGDEAAARAERPHQPGAQRGAGGTAAEGQPQAAGREQGGAGQQVRQRCRTQQQCMVWSVVRCGSCSSRPRMGLWGCGLPLAALLHAYCVAQKPCCPVVHQPGGCPPCCLPTHALQLRLCL